MPRESDLTLPSREQLIAIIRIQTEIARQGLDLAQVMSVVVERALELVKAEGAVIELAEDEEMVYRAVSGIAAGQLGLRLKLASSLSGRCVLSGEILRCIDTGIQIHLLDDAMQLLAQEFIPSSRCRIHHCYGRHLII